MKHMFFLGYSFLFFPSCLWTFGFFDLRFDSSSKAVYGRCQKPQTQDCSKIIDQYARICWRNLPVHPGNNFGQKIPRNKLEKQRKIKLLLQDFVGFHQISMYKRLGPITGTSIARWPGRLNGPVRFSPYVPAWCDGWPAFHSGTTDSTDETAGDPTENRWNRSIWNTNCQTSVKTWSLEL